MAVAVLVAGCADGALLHETGATIAASSSPPTSVTSTTLAETMTTASTTTSTSQPPAMRPPRQIRLAFSGDTMAHDAVLARGARNGEQQGIAADFTPMWQLLRPTIEHADLALCHLETTITIGEEEPTGFPRFRAPNAFVTALADAGYDGCSLASNHAFDYGADGVHETIAALEQSGLGWAGTARSADEAARTTIYRVSGVTVADLSATYGLNGFRLPDDQPWLVEQIDVGRLLEQAHAARDAGADIVVVSLHCCVEYRTEPTDAQVRYAHELLQSPDIDLVVGHHAHVVQPIDRIGDEYVFYGLGNILSNMYESRCCPAASQDGVVVEATFTEGIDGRFHAERVVYTPTWVDRAAGFVITPVAAALHAPDLPAATRAALEASWQRTVDAIGSRGAGDQGVAPSDVP